MDFFRNICEILLNIHWIYLTGEEPIIPLALDLLNSVNQGLKNAPGAGHHMTRHSKGRSDRVHGWHRPNTHSEAKRAMPGIRKDMTLAMADPRPVPERGALRVAVK